MFLEESSILNEYFNYLCLEKSLSSAERNSLKDSDFAIPEDRKFPIYDKKHVLKAIQFFKYCPADQRKMAAKRIKNAADRFEIEISKESLIYKYL